MALAKIVGDRLEKRIDKYADEMTKILKGEVHVKSGALHDSIEKKKLGVGHYFSGVNGEKLKADPRNVSKTNYAIPYYKGHKAYIIRPRKAKALRWIGNDGKEHFAKYVRFPASAGDKFVDRAVLKRPKL